MLIGSYGIGGDDTVYSWISLRDFIFRGWAFFIASTNLFEDVLMFVTEVEIVVKIRLTDPDFKNEVSWSTWIFFWICDENIPYFTNWFVWLIFGMHHHLIRSCCCFPLIPNFSAFRNQKLTVFSALWVKTQFLRSTVAPLTQGWPRAAAVDRSIK